MLSLKSSQLLEPTTVASVRLTGELASEELPLLTCRQIRVCPPPSVDSNAVNGAPASPWSLPMKAGVNRFTREPAVLRGSTVKSQ
jgi:hypothetical protein